MKHTPIYPDLRGVAATSIVIAMVLIVFIQLVFDVSPELILLKIGVIITMVSVFWLMFDRFLWRWTFKGFKIFGYLTKVPDLNGRWEGTINREGENNPHAFVSEITQTFSKIRINTFTRRSSGHSLSAIFTTDDVGSAFYLIHVWETRGGSLDGSPEKEDFCGTSFSSISIDKENNMVLDEEYFTRRNKSTRGSIRLKKISNQKRGQFE
jgi:SMODS-associating 2TM, beta-strand rich effector domain